MNTAAEELWARVNALAVERDSLQAELETVRALLSGAGFDLKSARADVEALNRACVESQAREEASRAVAFEEAARAIDSDPRRVMDRHHASSTVRALAPLSPALCVAGRDDLATIAYVLRAAEYWFRSSGHAGIAEHKHCLEALSLAALEAGR